MAHLAKVDAYKRSHEPLKAFEFFSGTSVLCSQHPQFLNGNFVTGAGGLSQGFEQSGFVDVKWAAEMNTSAARTFKYEFSPVAF